MSHLPGQSDTGPEFQFTSLTDGDREDIVDLAGNFNIPGAAYIPTAQMDLTALGADVQLDGLWNAPSSDLTGWHHVATSGRDHYVKIVRRGYLFPLGHRAVNVIVVERLLASDPANPDQWSDAVLQSQTYVKVTQPLKTYPAPGQPFSGHSWPFSSVELKTLITPPLQQPLPAFPAAGNSDAQAAEMLDASDNPVMWSMVATDEAGHAIHLILPLIFVYGGDDRVYIGNEFDPAYMQTIAAAYNTLDPSMRQWTTGGEPMMFAPEAGAPVGSTTHPVLQITLEAATSDADPTASGPPPSPPSVAQLTEDDQPSFYPVLGQARVRLPAADLLSGTTFGDSQGEGVGVEYYPPYVMGGLPNAKNPGTVYAALTESTGSTPTPPVLSFPTDKVGGISAPNIALTGLSAVAGLVAGDLPTYATKGAQIPSEYFKPLPTQMGTQFPLLFGGLSLANILESFEDAPFNMPLVVNQLDETTGVRTIHYSMTASLQNWPSTSPVFQPNAGGSMTLDALIMIAPNQSPTYKVKGSIDPFLIDIIGTSSELSFITIPIKSASFTSLSGSKADVTVAVGSIEFQGPLTFLNALEEFLGAFGQGFQVSVTPTEIKAGFSFTLPTIEVGVVSISNFGLSTSLEIPFLNAPALATFSFASQAHQFLVTVDMFGGGGYVTLVLGLTSVQTVSISIQFEGNFALDIYVASGSLSVAAGVSYLYQKGKGVTLVGFVHITGEVEVLGIISVTAELDMELTFVEGPTSSSISGTASLTISVHIIFFTVSVGFTITKQFSGSTNNGVMQQAGMRSLGRGTKGDDSVTSPTFASIIPDQATWSTYCSSFAA